MKNADWHPDVLPPDAQKTLSVLGQVPALGSFYLAGGTALALQWGHRTSFDLDFFSSEVVIPVADPRDIAAMKLTAVASRGTKRDFIDLYVLAQRYGVDEILRLLERKFSPSTLSDIHIKKSLTYFADAEKDAMPHMLQAITWDQVKQYFVTVVPKL